MIFSCVKLLYRRKLKNQQASRPRTGCCCSRCGGPFRPIAQPIKIARAVPSPLGRMLKASCRGAAASEAPSPPRAAAAAGAGDRRRSSRDAASLRCGTSRKRLPAGTPRQGSASNIPADREVPPPGCELLRASPARRGSVPRPFGSKAHNTSSSGECSITGAQHRAISCCSI